MWVFVRRRVFDSKIPTCHTRSRMKSSAARLTLPVVEIVGRARGQLASPVDGRYAPLDPKDLRPAIERLARQVDLKGIEYALGIPEGGYIPAYAFAVETGLRVVLASVYEPRVSGVVSFVEEHDRPPIPENTSTGSARAIT